MMIPNQEQILCSRLLNHSRTPHCPMPTPTNKRVNRLDHQVCSLIDPPDLPWRPALWQWGLDLVLAHLDISIEKLHLRVEDRKPLGSDRAFGIAIQRWHLSTTRPGAASMGSPRRSFDMANIQVIRVWQALALSFTTTPHSTSHQHSTPTLQFYFDPTCGPREVVTSNGDGSTTTSMGVVPRDGFLCAETGLLVIDFPNLFQCLINHEVAPYGQGKRFKVAGRFTGVLLVFHEQQVGLLLLLLYKMGSSSHHVFNLLLLLLMFENA